MKIMQTTFLRRLFLAAAVTFSTALFAPAGEPTAFDLIQEGNRFLGEQSKDKVVQIRSEKSIGSLTPSIWHIVYYDPDAKLKAVEVKFGAGKKLGVSHPLRLLEPVTGDDKILDRSKLKTDSDKAINIAAAEPLLKPLTLKAAQLWLQHGDEGPVWKVRLWAAKLKKPSNNVDVGDVYIAAADGKVIRTDLHINRVD